MRFQFRPLITIIGAFCSVYSYGFERMCVARHDSNPSLFDRTSLVRLMIIIVVTNNYL